MGMLGVLGCCAGQLCAAETVSAITPLGDTAPLGVAGTAMPMNTVPAPVDMRPAAAITAPPLPQNQVLVSIDFADAPVAEIVSMIARQANINILINDDVTGRLKNVRMEDVTAEQAIRTVAQTANLTLTRAEDNKTYILSKGLPASVAVPVAPARNPWRVCPE
jgi:type II secretory pathway component GspD/PulD (secretin)